MESHRYAFFGQKTAMVLSSASWSEPHLFLAFIRKRDSGHWERLADGRAVKVSLPEIAMLLAVARGERGEWATRLKSGVAGPGISARRESGNDRQPSVVLAAVGYVKPVEGPDLAILEALLAHVFQEKIAHATGGTPPPRAPGPGKGTECSTSPPPRPPPAETARNPSREAAALVPAKAASVLRLTDKAVQVANRRSASLWVPKSAIAGSHVPAGPQAAPWSFALKGWFAAKPEVAAWLGG